MTVDYVAPQSLPSEACPHIRQERHWLKPPAVGHALGAYMCEKHGLALGEELEKCRGRADESCWYEQRLEAGME